MDNIIDKQISPFAQEAAPINSTSNNQQNQHPRVRNCSHLNSGLKVDMICKQSALEDKQFLQSQQEQGQSKTTMLKIIRNPEIQTLSLPKSKQLQNIISSDTYLPKQSQLFEQALYIQKDIVSNCPQQKHKDYLILKLGLADPDIRDSKNSLNKTMHIRKLKSGFIYRKKTPQQIEQQNKSIVFADDSQDLKESPTSILAKQRNSPRKKQISQMAQILKMLEIRLATFQKQSQSDEGIQKSELKKQRDFSKGMIQGEKNNYICSGVNQIKLKHIDLKRNQQINRRTSLPSKCMLNKSTNEQIINKQSERADQDINAQSDPPHMPNEQNNQLQLDISIEKQALQKQIERLNKTIRSLRYQNNRASRSAQIKEPLYLINQSAYQKSNQIAFPKQSKKKASHPSNRLLDAGKIVHLSSNISFSRLAKQINLPKPRWQVPLMQVQFRDIIVPAIPQAPSFHSSQQQLQKLAQLVYRLLGVTMAQGRDLVIRKYKNCVLFDVLHKQSSTILWHYSGKFYFGGWCKKIGEKHGSGIEVAPKKYSYEGQFLKGKRHGSGVLRTFQGQIYDGQWLQGSRHGRGAHLDPATRAVFNGEWKFDQKEGQGWLKISSKQYYFGIFRNGEKEGFGTEQFSNGDKYRGQYKKNKFHGRGCYYWAKGARYQGDFLQGLREGLGSWISAEGTDIYIGNYKGDHKCGYGRYISESGCIYEGEFDKDSRHGKGRLTYPDGTEIKGVWKQGLLVPLQNMRSQHEDRPLTRNNRQFSSKIFATPKKNNVQQH